MTTDGGGWRVVNTNYEVNTGGRHQRRNWSRSVTNYSTPADRYQFERVHLDYRLQASWTIRRTTSTSTSTARITRWRNGRCNPGPVRPSLSVTHHQRHELYLWRAARGRRRPAMREHRPIRPQLLHPHTLSARGSLALEVREERGRDRASPCSAATPRSWSGSLRRSLPLWKDRWRPQ